MPMNQLLEWDRRLFLELNNLGQPAWDAFWVYMSETEVWIPLYALLLIMIYNAWPRPQFWFALGAIVVNVVLTDTGSVWLFKEQFQRLRPCHVEAIQDQIRLVKGSCGGQFGFLSSHASNTFGVAVLAGLLLKPRSLSFLYLLLIWAALVSYSRVYLGVHYPLDILSGAIYGVICGLLSYRLFRITSQKWIKE